MKLLSFLRTIAVIAVSLSCAQAYDFSKLTGKWTGERREVYDGTGVYSKVSLNARPLADEGLLIVESGKLPKLGRYTWRHSFHADGRYRAIAKNASGVIFATTKGTWVEDGKLIRISGKNVNLTGSSTFEGKIERLPGGRLKYTGMSGTARVVLTGKR